MNRLPSSSGKAIPGKLLDVGLIAASLILTFGIQIGNLGLYGDDWAIIYSSEIPANTSFLERQLQSILINLAGLQPAIYHLATLLLLFVIGWLIYCVLIQIGIDRLSAIGSILLFELYPGFLQPVSGIKVFGFLIGFALILLSVLLFLKWQGTSAPGEKYFFAGIISSISSIFVSPFSAALVCISSLLIFPWKRKTIKRNESYMLGAILIISGFIGLQRFSTEKVVLNTNLFIRTIRTWLESFLVCWRQILSLPRDGGETLTYLLFMLIAAGALFWLLRNLDNDSVQFDGKSDPKENVLDFTVMAGCAIAGLCTIGLLGYSGYKLEIRYPDDIPMVSIGALAAIFVVLGLKQLFLPKYRLAILVLFIALAGGTKFAIINRYSVENTRVVDMLAQMSVRADYFQSGIVLVSEQLPFNYTSERSIDALLKLRFNNETEKREVTYISADDQILREFIHNPASKILELRIGNKPVVIDKSNLIGFLVQPGGCLQILDEKSVSSEMPEEIKLVAMISQPELFETASLSDVKQLEQFRTKIENDWCFTYQLANRQIAESNWQSVVDTYANAEEQGLTPQIFADYLPILRASLNLKHFPRSMEISRELLSQPEQKEIICYYWTDIQTRSNLTKEEKAEIENAQSVLGCP